MLVEQPITCHAHDPLPVDPACRVHVVTDEAVAALVDQITGCASDALAQLIPDVPPPPGFIGFPRPASPLQQAAVARYTDTETDQHANAPKLRATIRRYRARTDTPADA